MAPRVRGNLAYQKRRGKVRKTGNGKGVRWALKKKGRLNAIKRPRTDRRFSA